MLFLLWRGEFAPFGDNTLAISDAKVQYIDFFAYLKDVLEGRNTIDYTFSAGLGGTSIAIVSYYLASPFNLLLLLFKKEDIIIFFNILVSLKIAASAATFSWFLQRRFYDRIRDAYIVLLSLGYALMEYNIANGSNVMWLDGVIMLPLILLGVHRAVHTRHFYTLTLPVGFSILFNWYTGGINCLFSIFWFAFEFLLAEISPEGSMTPVGNGDPTRFGAEAQGARGLWMRFIGATMRYGIAMAMGVLLSSVLFLPTVSALRKGKGSGFYPEDYLTNVWNGSPLETISGYAYGAVSSKTNVVLYCGIIAVIGCLGFFLCREFRGRQKLLAGAMLLFTVCMFYWQPLFYMFSLFQPADSYWFRYGYLGSFVILFFAGAYYQTKPRVGLSSNRKGRFVPVIAAGIWCAAMFAVNHYYETVANYRILVTASFVLLVGCLLTLFLTPASAQREQKRAYPMSRRIAVLLLIVAEVASAVINTSALMDRNSNDIASSTRNYTVQQQEQIDGLKEYDDSFYRVVQTSTKESYYDNLTASYDDALAYGYASLSTYTSCTEEDQLWFLNRLGYNQQGKVMNIINSSFLPSESLLGVKYILSPYDINGLEKIDELGSYNDKSVYENPYALPIAFVYSGEKLPDHTYTDPFTYTEEIYSVLSGEEVSLYTELNVEKTSADGSLIWNVEVPEGNYSLYGNLPWNEEHDAILKIGDNYRTGYAKWLSPSVFPILAEDDQDEITITLEPEGDETLDQDEENEQFYALDMDVFADVTEKIRENGVQDVEIRSGYVRCTVDASEGEALLLTIPKQAGWTYKINGEEVHCDKFAYCLMSISLKEGENVVELTYSIPYVEKGAIASLGTIVLLIAYECIFRKRKRTNETFG